MLRSSRIVWQRVRNKQLHFPSNFGRLFVLGARLDHFFVYCIVHAYAHGM